MAKKEASPITPIDTAAEKAKALQTVMENLNKKYANSVMKLGSIGQIDIPFVSTGILPLDVALGIGGLPRGRIIEIYGPEASGKTTVTLHMIAEIQRQGGTAAFIDAEHALDPVYAKKLGVNIDELVISQPDNGEQGLDIAEALIRSSAIDIIVIDSVAALVPKTEIDGDMGDAYVGLHARMMSKALRKLAGAIQKTSTIAIFINQLRDKVGGYNPYGTAETTTGGRALKFYATIRLDVRRGEAIKGNDAFIGNKVKIKVAKNKVAPPFRTIELDLIYGEGFTKASGILDVGVSMGVILKKGSHYYYEDEKHKLGNGKDAVKQFLYDNPEIANEIDKKVHELLLKGVKPTLEDEVIETAPPAASEEQNYLPAASDEGNIDIDF